MGWLWEPLNDRFASRMRFQFHYGMIVRRLSGCNSVVLCDFNSTMGWLWASSDPVMWLTCGISIPLWDDCEYVAFPLVYIFILFQFHYGMIVRITKKEATVRLDISIPLWDDCEGGILGLPIQAIGFQFHYGMIVRPNTIMLWNKKHTFQFHYGMIVSKIKCLVLCS